MDGFLPAVWKLLLLRVRISYNSFRHAKLRRKIGIIFVYLLILAFAGFLLTMSWLLLGFMRSPELSQYIGVDPQAVPAGHPGSDPDRFVSGHPAHQFWRAVAGPVSLRRYGFPADFAGADPGGLCCQTATGGFAQFRADFPVRPSGLVWAGHFRRL